MLKANRFLAIIALFLFVVIIGSCGGGGGGSTGTQPPPSENFTLSVNKFGEGIVASSSVAGIDCGNDCSESYPTGTTIVLAAIPNSGYLVALITSCTDF